jgi:hypothetical protein
MAQTTTMGVPEKTKSFFETHVTKEGTQYMAVHGDIEITGFTTSKTKAVVERLVKASLDSPKEVPPNVSTAADRLSSYVEEAITQFNSDYVSLSTSLRAGEAKMTLSVYLTYYSDDKITEWRGIAEALVEWRNERREVRHVVKRRVRFTDNVSGFAIYRQLMDVARHAYAVTEV